jgi:chromosomal replication initiation ATPase DnaA
MYNTQCASIQSSSFNFIGVLNGLKPVSCISKKDLQNVLNEFSNEMKFLSRKFKKLNVLFYNDTLFLKENVQQAGLMQWFNNAIPNIYDIYDVIDDINSEIDNIDNKIRRSFAISCRALLS